MAKLFDKRVAVIVNDLRVDNDRSLDGKPTLLEDGRIAGNLRIAFKVDRSLESKANKASAQIFNLNEDSRGRIAVEKPQFVIEAGYRDTFASIFQGTATEVSTTREATGFTTTVKAADGFKASRERVRVSLRPGATPGDAIEQVIKSFKISGTKALARAKAGDFGGAGEALLNGLTMSGRSRDVMDNLARTYKFDWSIQNEEIVILLPDEATEESAILLSPETGLIGSPIRVLDEKRPGALLVQGSALLHPGISPGRRIKLSSQELDGFFKIEKVSHTGDTAASTWSSEFQGTEI